MNSSNIMTTLETLRDALSSMTSITFDDGLVDDWLEYYNGQIFTCKIGMEPNITPEDYPLIRIVPSTTTDSGTIGLQTTEVLIYFGMPIQPFDDTPDSAGRVRMEKLYAALLTMEKAIRYQYDATGGLYQQTIFDEDRLDTFKLMAIRAMVQG